MKQLLPVEKLYTTCSRELLDFTSTDDLEAVDATTGQARAADAIRFAIDMPHQGYNLFVAGSPGMGKRKLVQEIIADHRRKGDGIYDWCYVNNFDVPHQPKLLRLGRGQGCALRQDMDRLIERLLATLPSMFQSDEYRSRMTQMQEEFSEREEALFNEVNRKASEKNLTIIRTPRGFTIGPVREGKMISAKEFSELPQGEQERIKADIEEVNKELEQILRTINSWQEEGLERVREANHEFVHQAIDPAMQRLKDGWREEEQVVEYLERVHEDVINNASDFFIEQQGPTQLPSKKLLESPQFVRYRVNVLVDNAESEYEPIHYEDNPTYQNLIGRTEHTAEMGMLTTNFSLIKPGALHRANGGYLILDAFKLLTNPFSYDALKRVLSSREIRIESLERMFSLVTTTSLEPQPMPIDIKVVLTGNRMLYHLLKSHDPEFSVLFKIQADFSETIERSEETLPLYARIIAGIARDQSLLPFAPGGVAKVIEHSARMIENSEKLSLHRESIADLMREAHYKATRAGVGRVEREHVEQAIESSTHRSARYQELIQESIGKGTMMIATEGAHVGQVNGLSVYFPGDIAFGRPSRITATARPGSGKVVDIERESDLGGTLHTKGVMIISALLASRYAREAPLPLSATLVFEQSYGPIDGDSASVAELLALLSAISGVPLKQSLAVTGSLNQHGQVQAIGGVNEKIEGFFDICERQGFTGDQGVVIPAANVRHLMLRRDVLEACGDGRFHIHAIDTLDDAVELFTDMPAGERSGSGGFEENSFNALVQQTLEHFTEQLRKSRRDGKNDGDDNHE